jgi:hypothetical protein
MTCTRAAATRSDVQALRRHQLNSPPLELVNPFCPSPFFLCHRTRHLLASSIRYCLAFPRTCLCCLVRVAGLQLQSSCGLRAPRCCLRVVPRRSSGVVGGTESQDRGVQHRELGRGGRQREQGFFYRPIYLYCYPAVTVYRCGINDIPLLTARIQNPNQNRLYKR